MAGVQVQCQAVMAPYFLAVLRGPWLTLTVPFPSMRKKAGLELILGQRLVDKYWLFSLVVMRAKKMREEEGETILEQLLMSRQELRQKAAALALFLCFYATRIDSKRDFNSDKQHNLPTSKTSGILMA